MRDNLLAPASAFIILLGVVSAISYLLSKCAFRKKKTSEDAKKAYSCGEEFSGHMIQPDYSQFFPFAFFFMILHVVAMVVATIPAETMDTFVIAVLYITGAVIGLFILLRK